MRADLRLIRSRDGSEPPTMDPMEARVAKLEEIAQKTGDRLTAIETRLTVLETRANAFATKEDMARVEAKIAESKNSVIMWVVSAIFLAQLLPALLKKFGM